MDGQVNKPLTKLLYVWLAVLPLISGCGPSLHDNAQACLAAKDAQAPECTAYWGKGQQRQAGSLNQHDMPPPSPSRGYPAGMIPRQSGAMPRSSSMP